MVLLAAAFPLNLGTLQQVCSIAWYSVAAGHQTHCSVTGCKGSDKEKYCRRQNILRWKVLIFPKLYLSFVICCSLMYQSASDTLGRPWNDEWNDCVKWTPTWKGSICGAESKECCTEKCSTCCHRSCVSSQKLLFLFGVCFFKVLFINEEFCLELHCWSLSHMDRVTAVLLDLVSRKLEMRKINILQGSQACSCPLMLPKLVLYTWPAWPKH